MTPSPDPYRWEGYPVCPCETEVFPQPGIHMPCEGTKLTKYGHVVGCICRSCMGRRNRRSGKAKNRTAHRRLAPEIERTIDDDVFHAYPLEVSLEVKSGDQIPAKLLAGCRSEWARHAWRQAEKKVPVGVQAYPAINLEVSPSEAYLVVRLT